MTTTSTAAGAVRNATEPEARPQPARKPRKSDRARSEARLGWLLAGPAFVVMLAVTLYPILQAMWDSLFRYRLTAPDDRKMVWFNNYAVVLSDPVFWQAFLITLLITVVTVLIELVLGFALALVMHRAIRHLRGLLRTAILIPYGIITVVSAFAWFYMFDINSGFVNSWFSWVPGISSDLNWFANQGTSLFVIIASEVWKTTPFISLLLLAGLAQVSGDLEEAAQVDGATWWQRLRRVVDSEHDAGDHGRSVVPCARRLPHFRQRLHHDQRGQRHRSPVPAGLPDIDRAAGDRLGIGDLGAAVPLCHRHLLHRHQAVQGRPVQCKGW